MDLRGACSGISVWRLVGCGAKKAKDFSGVPVWDVTAKKAVPATDANPWRVASCGDGFGFVFQLAGGAVGVWDVVPYAEVDRLVDGVTLPVGIEVARFHNGAICECHGSVGWCWCGRVAVISRRGAEQMFGRTGGGEMGGATI